MISEIVETTEPAEIQPSSPTTEPPDGDFDPTSGPPEPVSPTSNPPVSENEIGSPVDDPPISDDEVEGWFGLVTGISWHVSLGCTTRIICNVSPVPDLTAVI